MNERSAVSSDADRGENCFREMADAAPAMLWVSDAHHACTFLSRGWIEYTGQSEKEGLGTGWTLAIHPDDRERAAQVFVAAAEAREPFQLDFRLRNARGEYRWAIDAGRPRFGEDGTFLGYVGSVIDIHERKLAEEALRDSERDLNRAQAVARTGSWRLDVRRNELLWSDETHRMFQIARGRPLTYEAFLGSIHEEDRALVDARWRAALRGEPYQVEHRIRVGDGVTWVREKAELEFDENGELQGGFGTVQDITEAKRLQEALRLANEQLLEAGRRKDEFLGMLSHELRNPLAPIRNSVYILENADPASEQASRARSVIQRQTEHLTRLVDDLLDMTRIARGRIDLRRSRVELREVVRRTAEDFHHVLDERGVSFRSVLSDGDLWVDADAIRIAQVVGNLLHNAAKFTRRGDEVTLSSAIMGNEAEIRVRDTGSGIEPALLPHVFTPFVQGERTLARSEGGLGLGLALVKGIVELHGGTVRAESAGKGKGAEFVVRLPLSGPEAVEDVPRPRAPRTRGHRVLVVDDNVDAAESMADVVEMLGHVAEVAHDGQSALEKVRAGPPDIVLCDIGLPGMSGYDVAQALRKCANRIQLFAVSGYAQPEDVKKAIDCGFDGHVAKPVDVAQLERLLK
jgi:PAS domain S-box-containing protein